MEDSERIQELQSQVASLQQKLHDLHATDVNVLRRGYTTVSQHVDALKVEASRLEELVEELEPELYPPQYIADEIGKAAAVSGAVYGLFRLVKTITPLPVKASNWLKRGLFAVTAIVISWRFASSSIGRFAASLLDHKRRRKAFIKELSALQQRIDMLHALTSTMPGVQTASTVQARQQQQQEHLPPSQLTLPAAPVAEPAVGPASHVGFPPDQAQGVSPGAPPEHFVVVDLPRVHSGGFMTLISPVRSPAPGEAAAAAGMPVWAEQQQQQPPSHVQLQLAGAAAAWQHRPSADAGVASQLLQAVHQQPQHQQPPEQQLVASRSSSLGSAASAPASTAPSSTSAFTAPSSVLGWGSLAVQQQQQQQPGQPPWQQHAQQLPDTPLLAGGVAAAGATAAGRTASGETDADEGEWVDQPGITSADDTGSSSNGTEAAASIARAAAATTGGGDTHQHQQHSASSGGLHLRRSSPTESTSSDDVVVV